MILVDTPPALRYADAQIISVRATGRWWSSGKMRVVLRTSALLR